MKLLKKIADRKCYRAMGFTMGIISSYVGNDRLVKKLLRKGMDPKQKDAHGRSAIWWARTGWAPDLIVITQLLQMFRNLFLRHLLGGYSPSGNPGEAASSGRMHHREDGLR